MKKINIFQSYLHQRYNKKYLVFLSVIVTILVYGFLFTKVSAEEEISGEKNVEFVEVSEDIVEDTTWYKSLSPYVITNSISVDEGATLTIEPGVVVKFKANDNYYSSGISLGVYGTIIADGTGDESIYFTSSYDDKGGSTDDDLDFCDYVNFVEDENGNFIGIDEEICEYYDWYEPDLKDWDGIYLSSSVGSSFKNVYFRYASDTISFESSNVNFENLNISDSLSGLTGYEDSNIKIVGGTINNLNEDAFTFFDNSSLNVSDISITNVANGFTGYISNNYRDDHPNLQSFDNASLIINNTDINCLNSGVTIFNNYSMKFSNGNISCSGDGITLFNEVNAEIKGVKITGANEAGIISFNNAKLDTVKVTDSEITGNEYGFIIFNSTFSANRNNIHNNILKGVDTFSGGVLDFINNYWGDAFGPTHLSNPNGTGDIVSDNILFTPFLEYDPLTALATCCSNVLFLPGFEGSRLYKQKTILGLPVEDQLWEPNGRADVEDLYLNPDGTSINPNIYTRDIIQETNVLPMGLLAINIYKSFANTMNDMVDNFEIADWRQYAYDWRQGVEDIVENGTKYENGTITLIDTLQGLVNSSKNGKVTIIAHSNGGLVAKAFLKKLQEDKIAGVNNLIDSVDILILVASPEIGAASAVPVMMHGYDQKMVGGILMTEINARELGRNMNGAYGLLPSREYLNRVSASPVTFVDNTIPSGVTTKLVDTFGSALNSYTEYKDFLLGSEGRINPAPNQTNLPINLSENLFTKAESLHDSIDTFIPPESLRVIEVAGWGLDTVASYEYYPKLVDCSLQNYNSKCYTLDERPRFTSDGDKTVVVPSAHYMSLNGNEKYWLNLKVANESKIHSNIQNSHKDILEVGSLNNFIQATLKKEDIVFDTILKNTEPTDDSNRLRLSVHSPVTFDAYDINGNHTGKICPIDSDFCYIEENITNSLYLEFGEGKYINLPEDQMSKIELQGTDIGTFTFESEKILPDGTSTISSFVDIPVTTQTQVEIVLNSTTQVPELKLDVTGDGVMDFTITPKDEFDPILFLQVMKKNVESFNISKQQKSMLLKRIDDTIKAIQKGKIDKAELKIEQFKKALNIHPKENEKDREEREKNNEREHEKEHKENKKPKSLAPADVQTLIIMLNQLLDNLN